LILSILVGMTCALAAVSLAPSMPALVRAAKSARASWIAGSVKAGQDSPGANHPGARTRFWRILHRRRLSRLRNQLPQALVVLSTSVRAGLSLPQALKAASEQVPAPAGEEFGAVVRDTALGGTTDAALASFERRAPLPEVRFLVAGLGLARATGGSLAPLLDSIAETLKERERLRGQARALSAQGRLSGWVVGSVPVVMLAVMYLIDPVFVGPLFTTPPGLIMLGAAIVLEALGALGIHAVVAIDP